MNTVNVATNVVAILCFVLLFYRASLIVGSVPIRKRLINGLIEQLQTFERRFKRQLDLILNGKSAANSLHELFTIAADDQIPHDPVELLKRTIRLRRDCDHAGADNVLRIWMAQVARNYSQHKRLAGSATEFGMGFTIAGSMIAFNNLAASEELTGFFPAVSMAMATTLVGLVIAQFVKSSVGGFEPMLRFLELEANRIGFELAELETEMGQTILSQCQSATRKSKAVAIERSSTESTTRRLPAATRLPEHSLQIFPAYEAAQLESPNGHAETNGEHP